MLVLVYNENNNKIERYNLQLGSRMPYIKNKFLTVKEFRGSSKTQILWTTKKLWKHLMLLEKDGENQYT